MTSPPLEMKKYFAHATMATELVSRDPLIAYHSSFFPCHTSEMLVKLYVLTEGMKLVPKENKEGRAYLAHLMGEVELVLHPPSPLRPQAAAGYR
jgi:hypothetical protein